MRIALIGPESSGKSSLSKALADRLQMPCIAEYARTYVSRLQRHYRYRDVSAIAHYQIGEIMAHPHAVFDTELVLTQVWMQRCYRRSPWWLENAIHRYPMDAYIVCAPDLPWIDDPIRENSDCREELFRIYLDRVKRLAVPYVIIHGSDRTNRLLQALSFLHSLR